MATFSGTQKEFNDFLTPYWCKIVQNYTKKYRDEVGKCEWCGTDEHLQSAHVKGMERKEILSRITEKHTDDKGYISCDLNMVLEEFKKAHFNTQDIFIILCDDCHKEYDHSTKDQQLNAHIVENTNTVPIEFTDGKESFEKGFVASKFAYIKLLHKDGTIDVKEWNLRDYEQDQSNLIGNIRSKSYCRRSYIKQNNITKIIVSLK